MEGYAGKALIVNLTTGEITKEPITREMAFKYLGGEGFNNYYLWKYLYSKGNAGIDPLSPDNVLCVSQGPLGTSLVPLGSKTIWSFKSPVYNMHGDAHSGGWFTTNMRLAGYDVMVILGKARRPSYIWIDDEDVEIRNASHLWGLDVWDSDAAIKDEVGDENIATNCCGPAGENLVRYACIIANKHRGAGRTGGGCVMGSKNLKAVAARGTKGIKVARIDEFMMKSNEIIENVNQSPMMPMFGEQGSLFLTKWHDAHGVTGLRNMQYNCATNLRGPGALEPISGDWYLDNMWVRNLTCSNSCMVHCADWWKIKGDETPLAHLYAGECGPGMSCLGFTLRPTSEGEVAITGRDPDAPLRLEPNYLSTAYDRTTTADLMRRTRELFAQSPIGERIDHETYPGPGAVTDDELIDSALDGGYTGYHAIGSCAMGPSDDDVVDSRLRVRGVDALRVVDCSAMPIMLAGNLNGPVMAMAARAAEFIVEER
ncbi:MAG: aldehyde ferredoxin oxidoreductase N-terminal domain-containing protein [Chloroflexota bacterium]|nr:aldehyde ferredoxin oxidoreductase N-terminal domain-containing protein [Chloroflexota bacterium]